MKNTLFNGGVQPCSDYNPKEEVEPGLGNVHECFNTADCNGSVSFCLTCKRDHHSYGWETCLGYVDDALSPITHCYACGGSRTGPPELRCPYCDLIQDPDYGTGVVPGGILGQVVGVRCEECRGSGEIEVGVENCVGEGSYEPATCPKCNGTGSPAPRAAQEGR